MSEDFTTKNRFRKGSSGSVGPERRWSFAADRGGTFTDVVGFSPEGRVHTEKLLSEAETYDDAILEGVRRILGIGRNRPIPADAVGSIRVGTTVATNALLERRGEPVALLTTRGFRDLVEIGHQARPELFRLRIEKAPVLYREAVEVDERVGPDGEILRPLDMEGARSALLRLRSEEIQSVAIVLMHAWKNPVHERLLAEEARRIGFAQVSVSHDVMSVIKMVGRAQTTLVDAYLSPVLRRYVQRVQRETAGIGLQFMQSSGGLTDADRFTGKDAVVSGPAGGVIGCAEVARAQGLSEVIGFDMGGTSTDVCRYDGTYERVFEAETAGISFQAPMLKIDTVAAGGGSNLWFDGQKLRVGPESAGARPGPASYDRGGPLTVTDANVFLGRVRPRFFPKVFGPSGKGPLRAEPAARLFRNLTDDVNGRLDESLRPEEVALGFIRIANEKMCRPIKALSVARGFDIRRHALVCFGGAGGQHVCAIARTLGIRKIYLHPLAGLLSAWGIAGASQLRTASESMLRRLDEASLEQADGRMEAMAEPRIRELAERGIARSGIRVRKSLDLRPLGSDAALQVPSEGGYRALRERFHEQYFRYYGFVPEDVALEIVSLHVEISGEASLTKASSRLGADTENRNPAVPVEKVRTFFDEGELETSVFFRDDLAPGQTIPGPAILVEPFSTILVAPGFSARRLETGTVLLEDGGGAPQRIGPRRDPVMLEVFNHLFMSVAEQMGATLAQTAHSTNIKERLDFSCAIFDERGALIANAPHIPVHLGAMGESVRNLMTRRGDGMRPGDIYVTNDPYEGGSHLPDVTVVTPVFDAEHRVIFFAANRGHHADIGGRSPGSMPPDATKLEEEGVVLDAELLVRDGVFLESEIRQSLGRGAWPARNPEERISDLRAQIAANRTGERELMALVARYGLETVHAYMGHIQDNAVEALGTALEGFVRDKPVFSSVFEDFLDDGTAIRVVLRIERDAGPGGWPLATVDFSGTDAQVSGNLNAPYAVTRAAVMYAFRVLMERDIPLNDGFFRLIRIVLPEGSLLNPKPPAAVVGGNVETSQRVVDVLLGSLGVAAASQGTMNNFLFGRSDGIGVSYYETIGGGAGATASGAGASGVQVHMTNTRITDPEVLEQRFRHVRVECFEVRKGSGGKGRTRGGDGLIRALRFLRASEVTILSERRDRPPFGLKGGEPGQRGENILIRADGTRVSLPGKSRFVAGPDDLVIIKTPGGGGYGRVEPDRE